MLFYFAYGSNMNSDHFRRYCPNAKFLKKCELQGYRPRFGAIPGLLHKGAFLTLERNRYAATMGYVYAIDNLEDLQALQKKEGVDACYYTVQFVQLGNDMLGFTYVMKNPVWHISPSSRYCKLCAEFFHENNVDKSMCA